MDEHAILRQWSSGPSIAKTADRGDLLFEEQVRASPDKAAVVFSGGALTYVELDRRANQVARLLQNRGVGPNVPVAIALRRSPEFIVCYLGVFKAGGAVCLLDPSAPPKHARAVLQVVRPAIVIGQEPLDEEIASDEWRVLSLDDVARQLDCQATTAPGNGATADSSAYLLATSGSTGVPKIVRRPLGHRRSPKGYDSERAADVPADERHVLKTSSGTAFTHAEITRPLFTGGTLAIAPHGVEYDAAELAALIEHHQISSLLATPSLLSALLDVDRSDWVGSLQVINCIGEPISRDLKKRVVERLNGRSLIVSYGCTEALGATSRACSPADDDSEVVDVGRTATLMEAFVLDSRLQLCPIGVPGEIYLGGELATEYVNSPRETAERFVPHVFGPTPGSRLFRTGDLGRWLPNGCLEIVGRRDRQVKVRGYRVELGEVEAVLARCPGVKKVATVVREEQAGDRRIAAYVVTTDEHHTTTRQMRTYMKERVPEYMVPSWIVVLPAFPLTANGKLDQRALPIPDVSASRTHAYEPPQSELETLLAGVWADVLDIEQVGRNDDFFELGGHSLLASRLVARLRRECLIEAAVSDVFSHSVLADLASYLEGASTWL